MYIVLLFIKRVLYFLVYFFFSSRRRHTRLQGDWSSDVCSSDLSSHRGNPRLPPRLQPGRGEDIDRDQPLREDAGIASKPRESRLALGNREGSERKCSSIRIGARTDNS